MKALISLENDETERIFAELTEEVSPEFDTPGALFKAFQREYGRCTGKMYSESKDGESTPIGWQFEKLDEYSNTGDTYKRIAWVSFDHGLATTPNGILTGILTDEDVSWGTGILSDILSALLGRLAYLDRKTATRVAAVWNGSFPHMGDDLRAPDFGDESSWSRLQSEEAYALLDSLCNHLDDLSPNGYTFGTHPGDSSRFGWYEKRLYKDLSPDVMDDEPEAAASF